MMVDIQSEKYLRCTNHYYLPVWLDILVNSIGQAILAETIVKRTMNIIMVMIIIMMMMVKRRRRRKRKVIIEVVVVV